MLVLLVYLVGMYLVLCWVYLVWLAVLIWYSWSHMCTTTSSMSNLLCANPFIGLTQCPWLYPYGIASAGNALSFPWYHATLTYIMDTNFYHHSSCCLPWFWIRDSIREYPSTYEVLVVLYFVVFLGIVFTEVQTFITYFSPLCSHLLCLVVSMEGTSLSLAWDLPSTCTVLLAHSGLSLALVYLGRVGMVLLCVGWPQIPGLASTFQSLQIKEFRGIILYMNDSIYSCVFFLLTGIHLFHVVVGLVVLVHQLPTQGYTGSATPRMPARVGTRAHHLLQALQLVYWHFVELLWLFIHYALYS